MIGKIVVEVFQAIIAAVIPSAGLQEDPLVYRWRQTIGITAVMLILALFIHIAVSCGWFPDISTGFAWAEDLKNTQAEVKRNEVLVLNGQIITAIEKACDATAVNNVEARRGWYERLAELMQTYRDIQNRDYILPPCSRF